MVDALIINVNVTTDGMENCAIQSCVILAAMIMVNAKMEHACVSPDGMENTARLKVVLEGMIIQLCD
jgi:hypothetical protein